MRKPTLIIGALWALVGLCGLLSIMLAREYFFYRAHSAQLIAIKETYEQQVQELDALMRERRAKDDTASDENADKKKSSDEDELNASDFPLGVRIVSSDDDQEIEQKAFLLINRDVAYLRQSAKDYLREQQCDCAIYDDSYPVLQAHPQERSERHGKKKLVASKKPATVTASRRQKSSVRTQHYFEQEGMHERVFSWPIDGRGKHFWLSSLYGPRRKPNGAWALHGGIDMAAVRGTPVHAAAPGVVLEARHDIGWGKTILIEHNHKYKTRYAHLDAILVAPGQHVSKQSVIGRVGHTGNVRSRTGDPSHLHFEVYAFGKKINPLYVLGA